MAGFLGKHFLLDKYASCLMWISGGWSAFQRFGTS
jgi:hypothetical protein